MILDTMEKQPWDVKPYDISYVTFLTPGDTLASVVATAAGKTDPTDTTLLVDSAVLFNGSRSVKIWLSAGITKRTYKVTVRVVTTLGIKDECEFLVKVKDT